MTPQQPRDYVEDYDQLEELKSASYLSEDQQQADFKIIDIQEDSYLVID